jgi:hypothetical protein
MAVVGGAPPSGLLKTNAVDFQQASVNANLRNAPNGIIAAVRCGQVLGSLR